MPFSKRCCCLRPLKSLKWLNWLYYFSEKLRFRKKIYCFGIADGIFILNRFAVGKMTSAVVKLITPSSGQTAVFSGYSFLYSLLLYRKLRKVQKNSWLALKFFIYLICKIFFLRLHIPLNSLLNVLVNENFSFVYCFIFTITFECLNGEWVKHFLVIYSYNLPNYNIFEQRKSYILLGQL